MIDILKTLPHRYPFLMIDKVLYLDDNFATGIKNISHTDYYLQGHFPDNPIVPGVLLIEIMAQLSIFIAKRNMKDVDIFYLSKIDNAIFKNVAKPGDTLFVESKLVRRKFNVMKTEALIKKKDFDGIENLIVSAEITATGVKYEK